MPLPGHSIPYSLTPEEVADFISRHQYIGHIPPAGVIVDENYGQFLVWYDPFGMLRVVDVTNMAIAGHVNDAMYESPDSSFVKNTIEEIKKLIAELEAAAKFGKDWLPTAALLIGAFLVMRELRA